MLASLLLVSLAVAEEGGLSDAETNYTGAVILEGKVDAVAHSYGPSDVFSGDTYTTEEYAYWSGNTLYVGAEDDYGNAVDGIVEFFWFESSIDRGADFYVAVIKVRSTPYVYDDWMLDDDSNHPVQQVHAQASYGDSQAFRWDWSLPFESYGLESYGQATLRNSYGVGASAEGSAMYADSVTEEGVTVEGKVQAKGNVSSEYNVKTEFTTELWFWETQVLGRPGEMKWSTILTESESKEEESAYYEYFLVMQAEEGGTFLIDSLQISAGFDYGWDVWTTSEFGVAVYDIELMQPEFIPDEPVDTGDTDTGDTDTGDTDTGDTDTGTEETDPSAGGPGGGPSNPFADPGEDSGGFFGCSSVAGGSFAGFGLLLAGLALIFRRRD